MKTKYWHIFATDTESGKEHEVGTGKYTSKDEAEGAFKTIADNKDNKLVNPRYKCYSILSLLKSKCKTSSQRLAFNELIKTFADKKIIEFNEEQLPEFKDRITYNFNHNNQDNSFDSRCTKFGLFKTNIKPEVKLSADKTTIEIKVGDVIANINGYYNPLYFPNGYVGRKSGTAEIRFNSKVPEDFANAINKASRTWNSPVKLEGKRDPKFVFTTKVNGGNDITLISLASTIVKWYYAYLTTDNFLSLEIYPFY